MGDRHKLNEKTRIGLVSGYIDEALDTFTYNLINLLEQDKKDAEKLKTPDIKPIHIFVNSYGGLTDSTFMLVNTIVHSETPIYTYNLGKVASGGTLVFVSGHKRIMADNAITHFHYSIKSTYGYGNDIEASKKELDLIDSATTELFSETTFLNVNDLKKMKSENKDFYFSFDECLEMDIATDKYNGILIE